MCISCSTQNWYYIPWPFELKCKIKKTRSWCVRFAFFNFCYNNQGRRNRGGAIAPPRLWQISLPYSNRVGRLCTQHYYLQPPNFQTFLPLWTFAICIFFERSKKIALIDMTLKKKVIDQNTETCVWCIKSLECRKVTCPDILFEFLQ